MIATLLLVAILPIITEQESTLCREPSPLYHGQSPKTSKLVFVINKDSILYSNSIKEEFRCV